MSNGGLIGLKNKSSVSSASGVWSVHEQIKAKRDVVWPTDGVFNENVITENSTDSPSITIPASAQSGDIAVLFDSTAGTVSTIPSGWTAIIAENAVFELTVSYRILQSGDAGTTVSGQNATTYSLKQMLVFRPLSVISTVNIDSLSNSFEISTTPPPQTVTASAVTAPAIVLAMTRAYQSEPFINETWGTELFINETDGNNMKVYYEIQNGTTADRTVTTTSDYGTYNNTVSFALSVS